MFNFGPGETEAFTYIEVGLKQILVERLIKVRT